MSALSIKSVFVVDDESVIAFTLAAILVKNGFLALPFTHPEEALLHAESNPPDLLISDVRMPEMSGIDLAMRVRAVSPNTRVLLLSGQTDTSDLLNFARVEAHNFRMMSKPVHPADLLTAVRLLTDPLDASSTA